MKSQSTINQRYIYLLILSIAAIILWFAIKGLFFFDEDIFVTGKNGVFIQNLWQRSGIVKLSFIADNFLWGNNPAGYQYTNLILHLLNAVLALLVLKQLLRLVAQHTTGYQQTVIPYIFFLLFLLSPVHSEPLCYILARGGTMVTMFALLSVLVFLRYGDINKFFIVLSLFSFLLALFCYEISWMVPVIILCIIIFSGYVNQGIGIKSLWPAVPFFLVFALWFIIKVVVIDKMVVSDYKDDELFNIGLFTMLKNGSVLFLRNFLPPLKNSVAFLSVAILFVLLVFTAFIKLYKSNRPIFYLALLLLVCTIFGFAATIVFGIDSHDSESERYIYFSSVFAIMLLAVLLTFVIRSKPVLIALSVTIGLLYLFSLIVTINSYRAAGDFSKNFLQPIVNKTKNGQKLFFVNLPSQYKGALLFRAKSRLAKNTDDRVSVMQEYLDYLYNRKNVCITLSAKEIETIPGKIVVEEKPADSIAVYFSQVNFNTAGSAITTGNGANYNFIKGDMIVALKDNMLYFFK